MSNSYIPAKEFTVPRLYFAHPVNVFDDPIEEKMRELIRKTFPGIVTEDPNQSHHQAGYEEWKKNNKDGTGGHQGMNYYYEKVLPYCVSCVCMPFLDGKFGMGVAGEANFYLEKNILTWIIVPPNLQKIRRISAKERDGIISRDPSLVLSAEETRARTWASPKEYGKKKLPYEKAHRVHFKRREWAYEYLTSLQT